jgi:hypothetical protein
MHPRFSWCQRFGPPRRCSYSRTGQFHKKNATDRETLVSYSPALLRHLVRTPPAAWRHASPAREKLAYGHRSPARRPTLGIPANSSLGATRPR